MSVLKTPLTLDTKSECYIGNFSFFHLYFPGYLRDLVETTHVFLKIMENMAKSKHIMVSKKTKRKKKVGGKSGKKGGNSLPVGTIFLGGSREANEAKWDEISSDLSRILQGEVSVVYCHSKPATELKWELRLVYCIMKTVLATCLYFGLSIEAIINLC